MKKFALILLLLVAERSAFAQSNSFPASGNVLIGATGAGPALQIGNIVGPGRALASPALLSMDESYGTGAVGTNFKFKLFQSNGSNTYGLGVSTGLLEVVAGDYGGIAFFTNQSTRSMDISAAGNVGIGTAETQGYKLAVAGSVIAESIKVKLQGAWPDFVFHKDFQLPSLASTAQYIKDNGHLPGIPSSAQVKAQGIDLGEMNAKLLQKIEELTLQVIELNKMADQRQKANAIALHDQQEQINQLKLK